MYVNIKSSNKDLYLFHECLAPLLLDSLLSTLAIFLVDIFNKNIRKISNIYKNKNVKCIFHTT